MANKFTSGINHRHLDPFSICLESQSAFQCLFLDNWGGGGGGGGGGVTTLFYTIHKKRQNCSIKKCNSVTFSTHKGCVLPLFCLWKCTE